MNTRYETSDTALATWLVINQIKLLEVNRHSTPAVFIFDSSNTQLLNDLIFQWDSANAQGNCYNYYKTNRYLIHRVKD